MTGIPYDKAAQEDRCAPRARVGIPATLRASGGRSFHTVVHDLSLAGFCASAVNRLATVLAAMEPVRACAALNPHPPLSPLSGNMILRACR